LAEQKSENPGDAPRPDRFASADRSRREDVAAQAGLFINDPLLLQFLDSIPDIVLVLNENREIVYANRRMLQAINRDCTDDICGLRTGEVLDCAHLEGAGDECGATEFCQTCGAVAALLASLEGAGMERECRILRKNGEAFDFRVWATPLAIGDRKFSIFSIKDISDEKRRQALERVFFNDILNIAKGVHGFAQYLTEASSDELDHLKETICSLSGRLVNEIRSQRQLSEAESVETCVHPVSIESLTLLRDLATMFRYDLTSRDRELQIAPDSENMVFASDRHLLRRVLENMVKNALEAVQPGETVTMHCQADGPSVVFEIHNPGVMPRDVQLQIFKRSFSTKGLGRGLGAYSAKMFAERYLQGVVSFESSESGGTTFRVILPLHLEEADKA
jgi:hypothetical protein